LDIINSFKIENETFYFYDISKVISSSKKLIKLPIVLKILLEANLRKSKDSIEFNKIVNIFTNRMNSKIGFYPSRIIMKDFTGIPTLIDLASMRDFVKEKSGDVSKINPQIMLDLVIDNTSTVFSNNEDDISKNIEKDNEENKERYEFVKWAQGTFSNFRVIPPGSGICHNVNLEYLSTILHVEQKEDKYFLYPETIVGSDSQTTLINSLGVLGWGIDGVDAQAVMFGMPITLDLPKVVGVNIHGILKDGITSADLVLTLSTILKEYGVVGKLVEFYGESLKYLTLEDRSIISNIAPEYGAICSFFAIDDKTISYFNKTRDNEDYSKLIKTYLEKQNLFFTGEELSYDEIVDLDLSLLEPTITNLKRTNENSSIEHLKNLPIINNGKFLKDTDIVISTITSCTTSTNPYLLIHAALIAKKAFEFGLKIDKKIKTSLIPGTLVVKEYLESLDLLKYLENLGFNIVGYGCTKSSMNLNNIENNVEHDIKENKLNVCEITSEKRDLDEKNNTLIKSSYLMSPSLVILYSLIGTVKFDLFNEIFGTLDDKDIYLKDLWPSIKEVGSYLQKLDDTLYKDIYKDIFKGNEFWRKLIVNKEDTFSWNENSTYIQASKLLDEHSLEKIEMKNAGILALFGDGVSTDYISPYGQISLYSPAAKYLESKGVKSYEYSSFKSRRGCQEVMLRGTFDNIRLKNLMVSKEGAYTMDYETGEIVSIYEKSQKYKQINKPLVIIAGDDYGIGEQIDWASKGTKLLGIEAVIAKSFDERHKSSLIALGILPLEFIDDDIQTLKLKGNETISIKAREIKEDSKILVIVHKEDFDVEIELKCRLDNETEVKYYKNGGVLSFLLKNIK
jgi:aconitate hydratase